MPQNPDKLTSKLFQQLQKNTSTPHYVLLKLYKNPKSVIILRYENY